MHSALVIVFSIFSFTTRSGTKDLIRIYSLLSLVWCEQGAPKIQFVDSFLRVGLSITQHGSYGIAGVHPLPYINHTVRPLNRDICAQYI